MEIRHILEYPHENKVELFVEEKLWNK
jgi:hypothetical protein